MTYTKFAGLTCCGLVLGALSACSGRYEVGPGAAAGGGASAAFGTAGAAQGPGGVTSSGGGNAVGGGNASGGGNAVGLGSAGSGVAIGDAGPSMIADAGPATYCGGALSYAQSDAGPFATALQVWNRINIFIAYTKAPPAQLPSTVTRQWAGDAAMQLLAAQPMNGQPNSDGMVRFVKGWLPETANADQWATFFTNGTLADLLTSTHYVANGSGVLTDPVILQAPSGSQDISARGAYLSAHLLCRDVPPPPPGIPTLPPAMPNQTRRQDLEAMVSSQPACSACHALTDPLGDSLEHFAPDGSYETLDNGAPIDSSGIYVTGSGARLVFANVNELAKNLLATCDVASCFTEQLLADAQSAAQIQSLGGDTHNEPEIPSIARTFAASGLDLRTLIRAIVESDAFLRPE
jgi:hypothetical protein